MTRKDKRAYNYARDRLANDDYPVYSDEYELELAYKAGIEDAKNHPHWISVEDKLPPTSDEDDESDDYLIVDEDGDMNVGHYNKMDKTWFSCDGYILDATHWIPLPKMPILSDSSNIGKDLKGGEG